jgi:hypothetical protein
MKFDMCCDQYYSPLIQLEMEQIVNTAIAGGDSEDAPSL